MKKNYLISTVVVLSIYMGLMAQNSISEVLIPGGEFQMGDHYGFVDPAHPSDEIPVHTVRLDSVYMGTYLITNQQYCDYLNSAKSKGLIEVRNKRVYPVGDTIAYYLTNQYLSYYSISWNGTSFSVADFRANHPVVGVQWDGAVAYCNWLSQQNGLSTSYTSSNGNCDFTKNGYRLPTEAEWEFAGRGGKYSPYYIFPWGNDTLNHSIANWPGSGDPYESGSYPWTTPVGFYDGKLKLKTTYNWPGSQTSYQTTDGANAYGLYDMCGNVWQFINDWYETNYYTVSPYLNPPGPTTGSTMPDGKPCHGMRGGNWWSGTNGWSR
ncbi:MAG: formylglycine-generating enzyme family protein, partial [Bacteroidota bacterium]